MSARFIESFNRIIKQVRSTNSSLSSRRKLIFTIAGILFTALILGYLVFSQWGLITTYPWRIHPINIALTFGVYSLIVFLNITVWSSIMKTLGSQESFGTHFRSTTISAIGKRLPGTFWYVLWRAELYKDEFSGKMIVFASGIEMAVTVVAAVITCCLFSIPLILKYRYSIFGILLVSAISLAMLHPKNIDWILRRLKVDPGLIHYGHILQWVGAYILIWSLVGSLLFTIGNIFASVPIIHLGYFIGSTALTGVLSRLLLFSPSVFGFGEVSLSLLLSGILPSSLAVIIAISNRIIIMFMEILWALFSLLVSRYPFFHSN
jgi:hypothetical protein